jgi:hypothetical protein
MSVGLFDLDEMVLTCRSARARSLASEAVSCYRAGAFRAAIVSTWIAVVYDFIDKFRELALAGDVNAQKKVEEFEAICRSHDVGKSLAFERAILGLAKNEFELLSELEYQELQRLFEDRHKCAHPAMITPSEEYQPTAEVARYHFRNAVTYCLQQPPAQGKAALTRVLSELDTAYYPSDLQALRVHLEAGPLGHPRVSLLRNTLIVLTKELTAPVVIPPVEHFLDQMSRAASQSRREDRLLLTIDALVHMHRQEAIKSLGEKLDALVASTTDERLVNIVRLLTRVTELWPALSLAQQNRITAYVRATPRPELRHVLAVAWSSEFLHDAAHTRLQTFSSGDWTALPPPPFPSEWIEFALARLGASTGWDNSNSLIRGVLIPSARELTLTHLEALVEAAATNGEVSGAFAFSEILEQLGKSFGVAAIAASLRNHELYESMRHRLPWLDASSQTF